MIPLSNRSTGSGTSGIGARTGSHDLTQIASRVRQSGELLGKVHVARRSDSGKHGKSIDSEMVESDRPGALGVFSAIMSVIGILVGRRFNRMEMRCM